MKDKTGRTGVEGVAELKACPFCGNVGFSSVFQNHCDHCSADLNGVKHILCEKDYRLFAGPKVGDPDFDLNGSSITKSYLFRAGVEAAVDLIEDGPVAHWPAADAIRRSLLPATTGCSCCGSQDCDECGPYRDETKTEIDDLCQRCGKCINHCPHQ